ncbi:MAG TPA: metallophosphoesterase family protein [Anaeromyxobacteraceae bacterium]|nr:metallophosphoesterase family protein [Anaeromyxobacteraceae bacterium]
MRVGLVSDTHGLFEEGLARLFAGCDLILHAGDIVKPKVLTLLAQIAPVRAVRGNNDLGPSFELLPELAVIELDEVPALLVHQVGERGHLLPSIRRALLHHRPKLVVHGHSHRPHVALEDGVLFVNPGSAGPRRFKLPRSAGLLQVSGRTAEVRLFDLEDPHLTLIEGPIASSS